MPAPRGSIWQTMQDRGYDRRDFLQFCSYAAALAGLGAHAAPAVAKAFEKKARPPVERASWMRAFSPPMLRPASLVMGMTTMG